jgi:hypothetical protein
VFISLRDEHLALLYFRDALGKRFLLRELELSAGLDEVGHEAIGQVVETSILALLHSEAGVSREEAQAALVRATPAADSAATRSHQQPTAATPTTRTAYELGARGAGLWLGAPFGLALSAGVELAWTRRPNEWLFQRARLACDFFVPKSIATSQVDFVLSTLGLRAGVEIGAVKGLQALAVSVGAGIDLVHASTRRTRDPGLSLAPSTTQLVPIVRAELRYELWFGDLLLTAAPFLDVALVRTRYGVQDGGLLAVATPALFRPGAALSVGWQPGFSAKR